MYYEIYEVVKQYRFEIEGLGQVKGEILKTIKPDIHGPYLWRTSHHYNGYAPNHGNSLDLAIEELFLYIKNFDAASAELDEDF